MDSCSNGEACRSYRRQRYGGSCPDIACLPSKDFVHSAKLVQGLSTVDGLGIASEEVTLV